MIKHLPSGFVAEPAKDKQIIRTFEERIEDDTCMDATIYRVKVSLHGKLPPEIAGTYYIVSKKVADHLSIYVPNRKDFIYPSDIVHNIENVPLTNVDGTVVRYSNNRVVMKKKQVIQGCTSFKNLIGKNQNSNS